MRVFYVFIMLLLSVAASSQSTSKYICVDQFGYRTQSDKVAVIRDPQVGWDATESFAPGATYKVINTASGATVYQGSPVQWNAGATHTQSGDRCWWFDFSSVTTPGTYYVLDATNNVRSYTFDIRDDIYREVLKHAVRMFFYQRVGFAKDAKYAGAGWADGASHLKSLQDPQCRLFSDKSNAATEKDLRGGWYDAGDQNKYTAWTAGYCYQLSMAYREKPDAWGDDYNIPESGNGIPDVLDEVKWGLDHLLRMQQSNGSCLCIVGLSNASPPSSATGQSLYGPATTDATFACANAFATAALTFASVPGMQTYADQLKAAAIKAWTWATANPKVIFHNNTSANNSSGLGAGDQGQDDSFTSHMRAAVALIALTDGAEYKTYFENNYTQLPLWAWTNFVDQYRHETQDYLMYYTTLSTANASIAAEIKSKLAIAYNKTNDYADAFKTKADPYRAFQKDYLWGSNAYKGSYGSSFYKMASINLEPAYSAAYLKNAEEYVHAIHGVNPLNIVYLTNMNSYGAEKSVTQMYHSWFCDGSAKWDQVGVSTYGPPPGYVPGGPNPSYSRDGCCTGSCSSQAGCSLDVSHLVSQPGMKSYLDFNTNWPANSWSVTEPSCGYQCDYIRLLSKFVTITDTKCAYPKLGTDTSICGLPNITLNTKLSTTSKTFKWYKDGVLITGATANTYTASAAGTYMVEVDSAGCKKSDDVKVAGTLSVYLGTDVSLCNPATATLDAGNATVPNVHYLWSTKETSRAITVSKAGSYSVSVSAQNCATAKDTLAVTSKLLTVPDAIICPTQSATLTVAGTGTYEWYTASSGGSLLTAGKTYSAAPSQTTTYYVKETSGQQYTLGKTDVGTGDTWSISSDYLSGSDKIMNLSVKQMLTLQSLAVYVSAAGDLTLNLVQGSTVVRTKTVTGLQTGKQTVQLDLDIPAGDYQMTLTGSTLSLTYEASGASFPYTVAGVATLTYNESWQSAWYGYFYDIRLNVGISCARTPITVTVKDTCSVTQSIALNAGWNLISTNVRPADSSIVTLFKGLDVIEVKTMDAFWHKGQTEVFNGLQKLTAGAGYLVKMNIDGTLTVTGTPLAFSNFQLPTASNWYLIGCPYQTNAAFTTIFNTANCSVIKNFDGFWIPNGTTNSIQDLEIGKGYFIKK